MNLERLFESYTKDKIDNFIDYDNLIRLLKKVDTNTTNLETLYIFKYFDKNKDCRITIDEFFEVLFINLDFRKLKL